MEMLTELGETKINEMDHMIRYLNALGHSVDDNSIDRVFNILIDVMNENRDFNNQKISGGFTA